MVPQAFVRRFAAGQKIDLDVADQEVVLYYALALINEIGLVGYPPDGTTPGPLLFKGEECGVPRLFGLDPYEMIGEKIMACNRRQGGSSKDVYDLDLWAQRPFDDGLVRRLAVLKAWTDRRGQPTYDPTKLLAAIEPQNFRWSDIAGLVPRNLASDPGQICDGVRNRFGFLADLDEDERRLLEDQVAHREHSLFGQLRKEAREKAGKVRG